MKTFSFARPLCPVTGPARLDTMLTSVRNNHEPLMKTLHPLRRLRALLALGLAALAPCLCAQITIPGADGSDGALNITVSTNIDLSRAVTGVWDANNAANAGKGIYDPAKWAVVFKYSSVNIAVGATVTFSNHPSRAPVVWLVSGNVTIAGVVNLDGAAGGFGTASLPDGGPGGFRGGARSQNGLGASSGFGPGGGAESAFGQYGAGQLLSYGNAQIVPLIGGSGGAGTGNNGGGGGGAFLIAASGVISLSGTVSAKGGVSGYNGSGGAVRLVADQILGTGRIDATGVNVGRIRLEANVVSQSLDVAPITQGVSPNPVVLWPATNAPTVRVVSVFGQNAPSDPRSILENNPADVNVATTNSATVLLETKNFPPTGVVKVFVKPRNAVQTTYQAAWVSGTTNVSTWQVQHVFLPGYAVIQARAVAQ